MKSLLLFAIALSVFAAEKAYSREISLPVSLVCKVDGKPSNNYEILFTRLANIRTTESLTALKSPLVVWSHQNPNSAPKKEEIAWQWRSDYFEAFIDSKTFSYNLWTCDSEDRFYSFSVKDLMIPYLSSTSSQEVHGKLVTSVREEEVTENITCIAHY